MTPTEVKAVYNNIPSDKLALFEQQVEVSEIVVHRFTNDSNVKARARKKKLEKVATRIKTGEKKFEELATVRSTQYSRTTGNTIHLNLASIQYRNRSKGTLAKSTVCRETMTDSLSFL